MTKIRKINLIPWSNIHSFIVQSLISGWSIQLNFDFDFWLFLFLYNNLLHILFL